MEDFFLVKKLPLASADFTDHNHQELNRRLASFLRTYGFLFAEAFATNR